MAGEHRSGRGRKTSMCASSGLEPRDANPDAYRAVVIRDGRAAWCYEDDNVRVTAFPVPHGSWPHAARLPLRGGRHIDRDLRGHAAERSRSWRRATACDILVHEVYSAEAFREPSRPSGSGTTPTPTRRRPSWRKLPGRARPGPSGPVPPALLGRHRRGPGARDPRGRVHGAEWFRQRIWTSIEPSPGPRAGNPCPASRHRVPQPEGGARLRPASGRLLHPERPRR